LVFQTVARLNLSAAARAQSSAASSAKSAKDATEPTEAAPDGGQQ